MLRAGIEWILARHSGPDENLGLVSRIERQPVEVVDQLVRGAQQEIPPREHADRQAAFQRHPDRHAHLHVLGHGHFEFLAVRHVFERVRHGGSGATYALAHEYRAFVLCDERHCGA